MTMARFLYMKRRIRNITDTFVKGVRLALEDIAADHLKKQLFSERSENDTLPGLDNMTEEQWRMFIATLEGSYI